MSQQKGLEDFLLIIQRITFPGMGLRLEQRSGEIFLSVVCPEGKNNETGAEEPWSGRKWLLQRHMTNSEVVQTAFKAILTAHEHEARELFLYRGQPVMMGHFDLEQVATLLANRALLIDRREAKPDGP